MTAVRLLRRNIWNGWPCCCSWISQNGNGCLTLQQNPSKIGYLQTYIMDREIVRAALRTAREADATDQEWQDFIDRINRRMRSSGEDSDTKA